MSFNTALSGLSAASSDLSVTGNNIANASTVGFKASRAEFADVYASTLLGTGANGIGSGVKLANVAQLFDQRLDPGRELLGSRLCGVGMDQDERLIAAIRHALPPSG